MRGVHEDQPRTSPFLYTVYHIGNIVRCGDEWGVVAAESNNKYHSRPTIIWLVDGKWSSPAKYDGNGYMGQNISAPYAHTYEGIPDEVLAKSTEIQLKGGL